MCDSDWVVLNGLAPGAEIEMRDLPCLQNDVAIVPVVPLRWSTPDELSTSCVSSREWEHWVCVRVSWPSPLTTGPKADPDAASNV